MIPLWLKLAYTVFAVVTVVVYARKYPAENFFWFSDIALLLTVAALWLESSLIASMMALAILIPDAVWIVSFFGRLLTGKRISGLTDYMFDPAKPRYLRALSLFHVFLPVLLVWMIAKLGYAATAFFAQTLLAWMVLLLTYRFADPELNVNWVRRLGGLRAPGNPRLYLAFLMAGFSLVIYLPTHLVLMALFGQTADA